MRLSYRLCAATAVAATGIFAVAAPGAAAASSAAGAAHHPSAAGQQAAVVPGGTQMWAQRFGGAHLSATATSVAASPGKAVVYVTGITTKTAIGLRNAVTVAYNAATGKQLWLSRYQGTGRHPRGSAGVPSIMVSPDGATVYVAGDLASGGHNDYLVLAYNAATGAGAQLWLDAYKQAYDRSRVSLAVSPDSATVYVTSGSNAPGSVPHYWTAALDATTGATVWQATYHGPGTTAGTTAIALSPDGSAVYVTGSVEQASDLNEYATIGYDAATGHQLWLANYRTAKVDDNATGLAISADGSTVYVTGTSIANYNTPADYATVAYRAASGAQLWSARYAVTGAQNNAAGVVASGGNAIVTGTSGPYGSPSEFATVAYQG